MSTEISLIAQHKKESKHLGKGREICTERQRYKEFFMGHFRPLLFFIFVFSIWLTINVQYIIFGDDWI